MGAKTSIYLLHLVTSFDARISISQNITMIQVTVSGIILTNDSSAILVSLLRESTLIWNKVFIFLPLQLCRLLIDQSTFVLDFHVLCLPQILKKYYRLRSNFDKNFFFLQIDDQNNPLVPTASFVYPLKTTQSRKFF